VKKGFSILHFAQKRNFSFHGKKTITILKKIKAAANNAYNGNKPSYDKKVLL